MICDIILSKKLKGFQIWEQKRFLADRSKQFAAEFAMIEQKL